MPRIGLFIPPRVRGVIGWPAPAPSQSNLCATEDLGGQSCPTVQTHTRYSVCRTTLAQAIRRHSQNDLDLHRVAILQGWAKLPIGEVLQQSAGSRSGEFLTGQELHLAKVP